MVGPRGSLASCAWAVQGPGARPLPRRGWALPQERCGAPGCPGGRAGQQGEPSSGPPVLGAVVQGHAIPQSLPAQPSQSQRGAPELARPWLWLRWPWDPVCQPGGTDQLWSRAGSTTLGLAHGRGIPSPCRTLGLSPELLHTLRTRVEGRCQLGPGSALGALSCFVTSGLGLSAAPQQAKWEQRRGAVLHVQHHTPSSLAQCS